MGNCQAAEAATVVIQHPGGRVERIYWPVTASDVMNENPGHYVALIISFSVPHEKRANGESITRVKLLRPKDNLHFGQVYRLVTTQDVMKGLWAKKYGKTSKTGGSEDLKEHPQIRREKGEPRSESEEVNQVTKQDRHKLKNSHSSKLGQWRPSLQSISEVGS